MIDKVCSIDQLSVDASDEEYEKCPDPIAFWGMSKESVQKFSLPVHQCLHGRLALLIEEATAMLHEVSRPKNLTFIAHTLLVSAWRRDYFSVIEKFSAAKREEIRVQLEHLCCVAEHEMFNQHNLPDHILIEQRYAEDNVETVKLSYQDLKCDF